MGRFSEAHWIVNCPPEKLGTPRDRLFYYTWLDVSTGSKAMRLRSKLKWYKDEQKHEEGDIQG